MPMTDPAAISPTRREVYWIPRHLLDPGDPKDGRPAVVIEVVAGLAGRVRVVTRTRDSARDQNGVHHDAQPDLRLNDESWLTDEYWIDSVLFTDPPVEY